MMSLRLTEGLDVERYSAIAQAAINPIVIRHLVDLGMINAGPDRISATPNGRMVLNAIIRDLAED